MREKATLKAMFVCVTQQNADAFNEMQKQCLEMAQVK